MPLYRINYLSKQQIQVFLLYFSTILGTILGVLSSIVNTSFLDPSDYGNVRYVQNILNFFASILLFGYFVSGSRLLALSNDEYLSRRIRGAMVVILAVASFVLMLFTGITGVLHYKQSSVAWLFIVSLPVCAQPLLLNYINTTAQGDNHIGRLAVARLLPALLYIPIGYYVYSNFGSTSTRFILLQWGIYTLVFVMIIISTRPLFKNLRPVFKDLVTENKSYGIQLYVGSLFMVASGYLAGIFMGLYNSDNSNVGFYTLAMTITTPLALLPTIVGTTYFRKFASQPQIPKKLLIFTFILTAASCVLFIAIIQPIVKFLYSEDYQMVGIYASWLSVGFCVHGLGDMVNRYLGSHGQGKQIRNSSIACGAFKIFGFAFLVWLWDINGALLTVVISDIIYAVTMFIYYKRFIYNKNL